MVVVVVVVMLMVERSEMYDLSDLLGDAVESSETCPAVRQS